MIKLQVLLKPRYRTESGVGETRRLLSSLGISPTSSSLASVAATVELKQFAKLFGDAPSAEALSQASGVLLVPKPLRNLVQSITIAPRHTYFDDRN